MTLRSSTIVAALLLTSAGILSAQVPAAARADARAGKVDAAIAALNAAPKSAEAHSLLCSLYTSIEQRDQAVSECEAAVQAAPQNSNYALNLARAYGDKADHAGALTGMRMVGKIRSNFEKAVDLDGKNIEALSDLGQFYNEAPGMVGGGADKAKAIVDRLKPLSPARAHRLAAMIASKHNDEVTALTEFRAEIATEYSPEAYVDLANFYKGRKQFDNAADNAKLALQADKAHGPDTLDAASLLIDMKRDVPAAITGLRGYLAASQTGPVASYAKAHVLLAHALQATGDNAGAQSEYQAAVALAHDYAAARKGAGQ